MTPILCVTHRLWSCSLPAFIFWTLSHHVFGAPSTDGRSVPAWSPGWWLLRRPGSGMEDCLPSLCWPKDGAKRRVSSAWCCVHTLRSTDSPDAPGYPGSQDFSASSQLASPSWMATVTFLSILGSLVSRLPTAQLISRFTPREALCHVWTWRCH